MANKIVYGYIVPASTIVTIINRYCEENDVTPPMFGYGSTTGTFTPITPEGDVYEWIERISQSWETEQVGWYIFRIREDSEEYAFGVEKGEEVEELAKYWTWDKEPQPIDIWDPWEDVPSGSPNFTIEDIKTFMSKIQVAARPG